WTRRVGGTWSAEPVPGISAIDVYDSRLAAGDANHVGIEIATNDGAGGYHVWFVERRAGTWAAPEPVVDLAFTGSTPDLGAAALEAGGSRAHVVIPVPAPGGGSPLQLIARTASGWQPIPLRPVP